MKQKFEISTDKTRVDLQMIYQFLTKAYWAKGRTLNEVKQSINNSIIFGMYVNEKQIGFARVLTDGIVVAHLLDVFIVEKYRGFGYSKKLMSHIFNHSGIRVKKWMLATRDAHSLYAKFGFSTFQNPEHWMDKTS